MRLDLQCARATRRTRTAHDHRPRAGAKNLLFILARLGTESLEAVQVVRVQDRVDEESLDARAQPRG